MQQWRRMQRNDDDNDDDDEVEKKRSKRVWMALYAMHYTWCLNEQVLVSVIPNRHTSSKEDYTRYKIAENIMFIWIISDALPYLVPIESNIISFMYRQHGERERSGTRKTKFNPHSIRKMFHYFATILTRLHRTSIKGTLSGLKLFRISLTPFRTCQNKQENRTYAEWKRKRRTERKTED